MSKLVKSDSLAEVIAEELLKFNEQVAAGIKTACADVAKECCVEIKQNSPKLTGSYKKGWRAKLDFEGANTVKYVVHNKTDYQLTHLLEHGHAKLGGGRAPAFPHVAPAEEHAVQELEERIERAVEGE